MNADPTEMNKMIDAYLNNGIPPSYNHLYYDDYFKGRIYYDYENTNKIIEEKRIDLQDKLQRLNEFQYLCNKNSFPENYKTYLFSLLQSKNKLFYDIMNEECEYINHTIWDESNVDLGYDYCALTPHGTELCENCRYYMNIVKRYKDLSVSNNINESHSKT